MKNRLLSQVSDPVWMSLRGKIAMISDYQNTVEILTLMSSDRITEMQTRLMKPSLWKTNMNDCEAHLKCEDLHWVRLEIQRYQNSPNTQIILLAVNAGLVSTLETFESLIALLSPSVDEAARTRLRESFLQAQPAETPAKNSASKKTYAEALRGMNSQRVLEPSSEILTEVNDQEGSTLNYE